jgi:hypothetical protein
MADPQRLGGFHGHPQHVFRLLLSFPAQHTGFYRFVSGSLAGLKSEGFSITYNGLLRVGLPFACLPTAASRRRSAASTGLERGLVWSLTIQTLKGLIVR